jgi:hypothetical protein
MLKNGGRPASGIVEYDRRSNKCFLEDTYIIMMPIITDQIICEVLKVIGRVAVCEGIMVPLLVACGQPAKDAQREAAPRSPNRRCVDSLLPKQRDTI